MAQLTKENFKAELEARMKKTEESLKNSFAAIRTGKASPALVDGLMVEYYGTQTKLNAIAGITAPEPRLLVIQPWDAGAVKAIEKAILASNLGITPMLKRIPSEKTLKRKEQNVREDIKTQRRV